MNNYIFMNNTKLVYSYQGVKIIDQNRFRESLNPNKMLVMSFEQNTTLTHFTEWKP